MAYFVAPTFNRHFGIKIPILARPNCAGTRMGHSRALVVSYQLSFIANWNWRGS